MNILVAIGLFYRSLLRARSIQGTIECECNRNVHGTVQTTTYLNIAEVIQSILSSISIIPSVMSALCPRGFRSAGKIVQALDSYMQCRIFSLKTIYRNYMFRSRMLNFIFYPENSSSDSFYGLSKSKRYFRSISIPCRQVVVSREFTVRSVNSLHGDPNAFFPRNGRTRSTPHHDIVDFLHSRVKVSYDNWEIIALSSYFLS